MAPRSSLYGLGVHQLEPFGVRLHEAVLDAVVDHLHEVAGAVIANAEVAILRCEREKDRLQVPADLAVAADHQAIAFLEAPDTAARSGVDVANPLVASDCARRTSS
jgi:hypothetical protein